MSGHEGVPVVRVRALLALVAAAVAALGGAAPALASGTAEWELTSVHAPTRITREASVDEVQTITVAANEGGYKLEFESSAGIESITQIRIPYDASAAELQQALERLRAIGRGNVLVSGGPGDQQGSTPYVVEFVGALAHHWQQPLRVAAGIEASRAEEARNGPVNGHVSIGVTHGGHEDIVDYLLIARNRSEVPVAGPVTVTDTLPPGLSVGSYPQTTEWSCSPPGESVSVAICTDSSSIAAGASTSFVVEARVHRDGVSEGASLQNEASIAGGGLEPARTTDPATVSEQPAPFGLQLFSSQLEDEQGLPYATAAGHPFDYTTSIFFNEVRHSDGSGQTVLGPIGNLKDIDVRMPAGFIGDPLAVPRCRQAAFTEGIDGGPVLGGHCPASTMIGTVSIYLNGFGEPATTDPVYDLEPPEGVPAEFGFVFDHQVAVRLDAHLVPDGDAADGGYTVAVDGVDTNESKRINGLQFRLWGEPDSAAHDAEREQFGPGQEGGSVGEASGAAFLSDPADCSAQAASAAAPRTVASIDSWQLPGPVDGFGEPLLAAAGWLSTASPSPRVSGCSQVPFAPSLGFAPSPAPDGTTEADEPSGYQFTLTVPQESTAGAPSTGELKDASVTLPPGVSLSPAGAGGLGACTEQQIGLGSAAPGACPPESQVGTVSVRSPLVQEPLHGRLYVADPLCSPCEGAEAQEGKLFRLYIEAEGSGARVKLAGRVSVDQATGTLTTIFENSPQLPFSQLTVTLKHGPRAPLANPQACGSYSAAAQLTPWSLAAPGEEAAPGGAAVDSAGAPFTVDGDGTGGACPGSFGLGARMSAGTEASQAGAYSPFVFGLTRGDREQDISAIDVEMPPGLLGSVAGVPRCQEPLAAQGHCPQDTRLGTVTAAAGSGEDPYLVSGSVYLTAPYEGAPFGLTFVVPAVAGPFNLGDVVVRARVEVNRRTAALQILSGPVPQLVDGVPIRLRQVQVRIDRPGFIFNSTGCEARPVQADVTGAPIQPGEAPASDPVSAPYSASSCQSLPFRPRFTLSTQANASKRNGASLTVHLAAGPGEANIRRVEVQLPGALPTRQSTLKLACTEAQFASDPAGCPEGSVVASATALTPLLAAPLTGPGYLVSHGGAAFPELVFLLHGEGVHIELVGSTEIHHGITYSRFKTVPDAPISSFQASFPEGPHSILGSYGNLCSSELLAPTTLAGQNEDEIVQATQIAVQGCPGRVAVSRARLRAGRLVFAVTLPHGGVVHIAGSAVRETTVRGLLAGMHWVGAPLTAAGRAQVRSRRPVSARATIISGPRTSSFTARTDG